MPDLMKNKYYHVDALHELALRIKAVYPTFEAAAFIADIIDDTWDARKLKERMRRVTIYLGRYLPADYGRALAIIDQVIVRYPIGFHQNACACFPDYVEVYGQDVCNWDLSMAALERYTPYATAEFAVRPFIIHHEERMMRQMSIWASHEDAFVRRLASEGCRPQLPWGQALPSFKKDPSPVLGILEQLKTDPSVHVRKSVANNLNDISKTHPDLVVTIAREWYGKHPYTDWIVKRGCRSLLKKGDRGALDIFGLSAVDCVDIIDFSLGASAVSIGESLPFSVCIEAKRTARLRLEYSIDYVKSGGKKSRKIFFISEISLKAGQRKRYDKTHSFADLSTRNHYPGTHSIALIIGGTQQDVLHFEVLAAK
ncbi:DNA alkylation repair protein [Neobittarella massiliensis]|uniref:DNA alkylation repair protein n=1 Tax=Neobittarella massiliensis (ex Bilen et al. 2018) TaxID=2041842 RepID=UPI000CF68DA6|nr:DNA alkylation repair protein [Neobittarella massiliensis]